MQSTPRVPRTPSFKLPGAMKHLPSIDRERLHYAQRDDALWVHGTNWKASFTREGLSFIPFLGSKAPHNFPITFTLGSVRRGGTQLTLSEPSRVAHDGDRIDMDRGELVERFDLAPAHIEHSFVFAS